MRTILALLFLFPVLAIAGGPELTTNTTATWKVEMGGDVHYDFIVKDITNLEGGRQFDYKMTNLQHTHGSVSISSDAMLNATILHNYFDGGLLQLSDATSVWLSAKAFAGAKKGKVKLLADHEVEEFELIEKKKMAMFVDGKQTNVTALYLVTDSGTKLWVLDNPKNPLILKMDLGWTLTIMEYHSK